MAFIYLSFYQRSHMIIYNMMTFTFMYGDYMYVYVITIIISVPPFHLGYQDKHEYAKCEEDYFFG